MEFLETSSKTVCLFRNIKTSFSAVFFFLEDESDNQNGDKDEPEDEPES